MGSDVIFKKFLSWSHRSENIIIVLLKSKKNKACKRKAAEQIYTLSYIMKKQLFLKLYVYTREYVLYYIVLILSNSRLTVFHISE